ncbi:MAG: hypothetical protein KGJ13_02890 [Patescibacteria group bacterium]|nr:hypothetical protein [Patescibacteria group bacterium]
MIAGQGSSVALPASGTDPSVLGSPTDTPANSQITAGGLPPVPTFLLSTSSAPRQVIADTAVYDAKMLALANLPPRTIKFKVSSTVATSGFVMETRTVSGTSPYWPPRPPIYPLQGALLPDYRIVAYYGNFYSKQMGVLGEYPPDQVLAMLASTTAAWAAADPSTQVIPAIQYIAVTAQGSAGPDGLYRLRMPDSQIEKAINMAAQVNGVVFLDVQVGKSTVEKEIPLLQKYLELPQVSLALDPEFDMDASGRPPGTVIGTMDAADINWAVQYLTNLVTANNLPPKVLIIHRFTEDMVTNYKQIKPSEQVQIVMDMDGFGFPAKKINTYQQVIVPEPVEFTGFKLFFKNDAKGPLGHLMAPAEVLKLSPRPSYIQYQ